MTGKAYSDIEEALVDIEVVKQGLRSLRFKDEDIKVIENPVSQKKLKFAIQDVTRPIFEDGERGINTLFFAYYAGHGQ